MTPTHEASEPAELAARLSISNGVSRRREAPVQIHVHVGLTLDEPV